MFPQIIGMNIRFYDFTVGLKEEKKISIAPRKAFTSMPLKGIQKIGKRENCFPFKWAF